MIKGNEVFCVNCWKKTTLEDQNPSKLPTYVPVLILTNHLPQICQANNNEIRIKICDNERKKENCHVHAMPLALWCQKCSMALCRACATQDSHLNHPTKSLSEAKEQLITEIQQESTGIATLIGDVQKLELKHRQYLLRVLESCVALKSNLEMDLHDSLKTTVPEINEAKELISNIRSNIINTDDIENISRLCQAIQVEKQKLQSRIKEMMVESQIDDYVSNSATILDSQQLKMVLMKFLPKLDLNNALSPASASNDPLLFLSNFCVSQLLVQSIRQNHQDVRVKPIERIQTPPLNLRMDLMASPLPHNGIDYMHTPPPTLNPLYIQQDVNVLPVHSPIQIMTLVRQPSSAYPLYFFNINIDEIPFGRIVIETRPDVAPKMAKNFNILTTGEMGVTYKGCTVFQCWENESIITGDFELNNGKGGRSIYDEGFFLPDDTKFPAVRGAVGMRRSQKRHDSLGMVGSQFRIILQEMRAFTGIFGHVVEGIELVAKIATFGDAVGKPSKTVIITNCGKLN